MSFHNRFLSLGLIVAAAKGTEGFPAFEKFMTNSAAYTYLDQESFNIHEMFIEKQEIRRNLWLILGTQEFKNYRPSKALKALCKCWLVVKNKSNEDKHQDGIKNYLHLVEKSEPQYKVLLEEIIQAITN